MLFRNMFVIVQELLRLCQATWGPFNLHGSILILAWISNHNHYQVWTEITYPFPDVNGAIIEAWEWMGYFMPHFTGYVIAYPYRD